MCMEKIFHPPRWDGPIPNQDSAPEAGDAKGFATKINQAARVSGVEEEGASRVNKTRSLDP